MNEFKVGDRVTPVSEKEAGDYLTYGEVYTVTRVKRPCGLDRVYLREVENRGTGDGWFAGGRFRLATPRKDAPKAGDTVRVVLEGPASVVYTESFRIGFNAVHIDSNHTVSIEILKPAKPSVKDLPVGSVVRTPGVFVDNVFVKVGESTWTAAASSIHYAQDVVDEMDWTLLVPQESE